MNTTCWPIRVDWNFSATWAPPSENTPGSVQPGTGNTRSVAPVARMTSLAGSSDVRWLGWCSRLNVRPSTPHTKVCGR